MERKWWHGKVAYQIYPKSFYDTNGDGIGDIPGIISKLDYLKELGVDIIWISPCYKSPLADQGYDISDYYDIDPRFGTMADMDQLIKEAKKRDMYILMDLVVNHCSDEHEWFQKACEDPDGKYGKYFYLEEKGEKLPTNWRSYFGGPVWEDMPGTNKQYLHVFHKKQPDLNWENPEVREEIYKNINWWLEKGLGGFRIDAIINVKKALPFRDYPADREDGLSDISNMLEDAAGVGEFLGEMHERTFKKYDAFAVGEVFNDRPEELPAFIGDDGYFSSKFDFNAVVCGNSKDGWHHTVLPNGEDFKRCSFETQRMVNDIGYISNIIENHDTARGVSKFLPDGERTDAAKKMVGGLNFMLKGLPFIFQGQEIGMENTEFHSIDEVDDCGTFANYNLMLEKGYSEEEALDCVRKFSRDNARTPMQWSAEENAGFTTGEPWLKVNKNYSSINVDAQRKDPDSIFHFYRQLAALRKNDLYKETVVYGELVPYLEEQKNLMAYFRKADKTLLVLGNYQKEPQDVVLPGGVRKVLINNQKTWMCEEQILHMEGYQFLVLEM